MSKFLIFSIFLFIVFILSESEGGKDKEKGKIEEHSKDKGTEPTEEEEEESDRSSYNNSEGSKGEGKEKKIRTSQVLKAKGNQLGKHKKGLQQWAKKARNTLEEDKKASAIFGELNISGKKGLAGSVSHQNVKQNKPKDDGKSGNGSTEDDQPPKDVNTMDED